MEIETVAIVLSVVSTLVTFVNTYINQFRRGRVSVPPLRAYRLEPLNFHRDGESYRAVRMTAALTFVNTGALSRVVDNLRIRIPVPGTGQDVFLDWRNECDAIEDDAHHSRFATQPSLGPYESLSKVYSFVSRSEPAVGKHVSLIETEGSNHPDAPISASLEMLSDGRWSSLRKFRLYYQGFNALEDDFQRINA